jgi:hypothetical protein
MGLEAETLKGEAAEISKVPIVLVQPAAAPTPSNGGRAFTRVNGKNEAAQGVEAVFKKVSAALLVLRFTKAEARERVDRVRKELEGVTKLPEEGEILKMAIRNGGNSQTPS